VAKRRSSVRKREREIAKRQRELKKSQRAAEKRERRLGGETQDSSEAALGPDVENDPRETNRADGLDAVEPTRL